MKSNYSCRLKKVFAAFLSTKHGKYRYKSTKGIKVQTVIDFYKLITRLTPTKQKILLDNIYNRLSTIKIQTENDELPF
jgi:hypothetical protein